VVVATGGGTFVDPDNRARILGDGFVVWLDAPLETAISRVPGDGRRPLAADRVGFTQLYWARRSAYQLAHARLDASLPVDAIVERLLDRMGW
jgi:shikimate kinase